jgi:hypothetical protein
MAGIYSKSILINIAIGIFRPGVDGFLTLMAIGALRPEATGVLRPETIAVFHLES